jgi:hypothetical protein
LHSGTLRPVIGTCGDGSCAARPQQLLRRHRWRGESW